MRLHTVPFLISLFVTAGAHAKNYRAVTLSDADVGEVHVALGFSSVLQFESRPSSAVLGDQDSFKVEYVGNSLTIKPLHSGARTNLIVFTEYEQFNFTLISGARSEADFVVRVQRRSHQAEPNTGAVPARLTVQTVRKEAVGRNVIFRLNSVAWPESKSSLILSFEVEYVPLKGASAIELSKARVRLRQGASEVSAQSVSFDSPLISMRRHRATLTVVLRQNNLSKSSPLTVELRAHPAQPESAVQLSFLPFEMKKRR